MHLTSSFSWRRHSVRTWCDACCVESSAVFLIRIELTSFGSRGVCVNYPYLQLRSAPDRALSRPLVLGIRRTSPIAVFIDKQNLALDTIPTNSIPCLSTLAFDKIPTNSICCLSTLNTSMRVAMKFVTTTTMDESRQPSTSGCTLSTSSTQNRR